MTTNISIKCKCNDPIPLLNIEDCVYTCKLCDKRMGYEIYPWPDGSNDEDHIDRPFLGGRLIIKDKKYKKK